MKPWKHAHKCRISYFEVMKKCHHHMTADEYKSESSSDLMEFAQKSCSISILFYNLWNSYPKSRDTPIAWTDEHPPKKWHKYHP